MNEPIKPNFIFDNLSKDEHFNFFIDNAKNIELFNKGSYGVTFTLELKDNVMSPYKYYDGAQIKKILLKLTGLCSNENTSTKSNIKFGINNEERYNLQTLTEDAMQRECELQNKVYNCGVDNNMQLCPKLLYCGKKMNNEDIKTFLAKLIEVTGYTIPAKTMFSNPFSKQIPPPITYLFLEELSKNLHQLDGLSVYLMEYADGYIRLSESKNINAQNYARIALLKLAYYCNVIHMDPNSGNILINGKNNVLLIDFGDFLVHKDISFSFEEFKGLIDNEKYSLAINMLNHYYDNAYNFDPSKYWRDGPIRDFSYSWLEEDCYKGDYDFIKTNFNLQNGGKRKLTKRKLTKRKLTKRKLTKRKLTKRKLY
jgi:serine/threonine protein kinase